MNEIAVRRMIEDYAKVWSFPLPEGLVFSRVRKWFFTVAIRLENPLDPYQKFVYWQKDEPLPLAFHFVSVDPNVEMLPLWVAYPTASSVSISWRMGTGEAYWQRWNAWLDSLSPTDLKIYKEKYPPPQDDRCWEGLFWEFYDRQLLSNDCSSNSV